MLAALPACAGVCQPPSLLQNPWHPAVGSPDIQRLLWFAAMLKLLALTPYTVTGQYAVCCVKGVGIIPAHPSREYTSQAQSHGFGFLLITHDWLVQELRRLRYCHKVTAALQMCCAVITVRWRNRAWVKIDGTHMENADWGIHLLYTL